MALWHTRHEAERHRDQSCPRPPISHLLARIHVPRCLWNSGGTNSVESSRASPLPSPCQPVNPCQLHSNFSLRAVSDRALHVLSAVNPPPMPSSMSSSVGACLGGHSELKFSTGAGVPACYVSHPLCAPVQQSRSNQS
ncbi:hypothetical protein Salat_1489100 [Sesamum alatum]|uniref:Uncharacterized protein n=1 Tax=Sesamum alatum TaxID=300844 RepID=A0AAE2CM37_9LAMI|nr:hypothetical protein Salat_1489100 [Sesamum alatum]